MKAVDWLVDYLIKLGCTDVFGIPGVVVMDFLYAVEARKNEITPHLSYHEQAASYAACGYAQVNGKLGVAYSTRGPGFTNMITAISDAYYDSIPTLFITAHSSIDLNSDIRVLANQEIDTVCMVKNVTKFATRLDNIDNFQDTIVKACKCAFEGRKGPVFLDIYNGLFFLDVPLNCESIFKSQNDKDIHEIVNELETIIKKHNRPVILIGNGARSDNSSFLLSEISTKFNIPILSSRVSQDIVPNCNKYFGFIGSRATRYSNFVLSKSDLIISLGNRLSFPLNSKSFRSIIEKCDIVRVDIDEREFLRKLPNCKCFKADVAELLPVLVNSDLNYSNSHKWVSVCEYLRLKLAQWDLDNVVNCLINLMRSSESEMPFVCDVGNNSFWVSTAYAYSLVSNRIIYSGSFGALGCALPKSIGAYYSEICPVICFTGDQGIQFNIQELQYISKYKLPITIVILNNASSGMIMEREKNKYGNHLVHTTTRDGYSFPDFQKLANCYCIDYLRVNTSESIYSFDNLDLSLPRIIEMIISVNKELRPSLPQENSCQNLSPELPKELFEELDIL